MENLISHLDDIERNISRMPQFANREQLMCCLSQPNLDVNHLTSKACLSSDEKQYEIIIENQRGTTVGGSHVYSKESVIYPIDPPKYQTLWGDTLVSIGLYPDPGLNWTWGWDKWHILMINDVDEEGWVYSNIRFGSKRWAGVGKLNKFVRRRIWVRLAQRIQKEEKLVEEEEAEEESEETQIIFPQNHFVKKSSKMDFLRRRKTAKSTNQISNTGVETKDSKNNEPYATISKNTTSSTVVIAIDSNHKEKLDSDLLKHLLSDLENAKIDRIKTDILLDFFFPVKEKTLELFLHDTDYITKILRFFTFKNSQERFIQKFERKLQELEDSNKQELLLRVSENFRSLI